jgi:hypothetical protein
MVDRTIKGQSLSDSRSKNGVASLAYMPGIHVFTLTLA